MNEIYAQVGSFAMRPGSQKGIHLFRYEPEQARFIPLGNSRPELNAGQSAYNAMYDVVYITDENRSAGGGGVYAFRINRETGEANWLGVCKTLATLPSYLCITTDQRWMLVPHHGNSSAAATKTVRSPDGNFSVKLEYDDATLVLIPIMENGMPGELRDVYWVKALANKQPHLHSCLQSPDGKLFLVCDKGLDQIHSFRLNDQQGKLQLLCSTSCEDGSHPRYGAFHPKQPIFYQNNENRAFINVWKYDSDSGKLTLTQKISLLKDEAQATAWTAEGASDLRLTSDGQFLYAAVRGLNVLAAFAVQAGGRLKLLQNLDCGGKNPRGICLSPDERYLFSVNRDTNNLVCFARNTDGTLTKTGSETECAIPANLQFICYE